MYFSIRALLIVVIPVVILSVFSYVGISIFHQENLYSVATPERLRIDSIGILADIESVSLNDKGELSAPSDPLKVGLYKAGPVPGQRGNAIIDGHYGWWRRQPAAFDSLHKLKKGDRLFVEFSDGKRVEFLVTRLQVFDKDDDASGVFYSKDDKAHLNLITCGGAWDATQQNYPDRLVVFTDMVLD